MIEPDALYTLKDCAAGPIVLTTELPTRRSEDAFERNAARAIMTAGPVPIIEEIRATRQCIDLSQPLLARRLGCA